MWCARRFRCRTWSAASCMNTPVFAHDKIPFDASGLSPKSLGDFEQWPVSLGDYDVDLSVLSMGNPHAVQEVADVDSGVVASQGPMIEAHSRFPRKVNAGFMRSGERMATRRSMTPASTRRLTRRRQVAGEVWTAAASSRLESAASSWRVDRMRRSTASNSIFSFTSSIIEILLINQWSL